jgi:hypothetical protein
MRGLKVFLISAGIFAFFDRAYAIAFAKSYGGTRYDVGYSVQQTSDGGYIMAGIFTPSASDPGDVIIIEDPVRKGLFPSNKPRMGDILPWQERNLSCTYKDLPQRELAMGQGV